MVPLGEMTASGHLYNIVQVPTGTGGNIDTQELILSCRGKLTKRSGSKRSSFGEIEFSNTWEFVTHYQSGLVIDRKAFWVISGKNYQIKDYKEDQRFYTFLLSEVSG